MKSLLSLAALLALPLSLFAQGTVTGVVEDATNGLRLEGVRVVVNGTPLATTTDRSGSFILRNVPSGSQSLRFTYFGTEPATQSITVEDGGSRNVRVALNDAETIELEDFIVTARQTGTARALNAQRAATNVTTVVAADALGQFPDQNIAESLQRLPGLSLERDQGEGRFVVVRGIDPDLSSTTINGVLVPATEGETRKVNLDVVPNDGVAAVEVTKAVTPDMDGDTIGGNVNIRTVSPFDEGGELARLGVEAEYAELFSEWGYKLNGLYGNLNEDGTIGYLLSFSHHVRDFGSDNAEVDGFGIDDDTGFVIPDEIEFREYVLERRRTGLTAALEFKPTEAAFYYIRGVYNTFDDTEQRYRTELKPLGGFEDFDGGTLGDLSGTTQIESTDIDLKDRIQSSEIWNIVAGGQNYLEKVTLDYSVSYAFSTEYEHDRLNADFRSDAPSRISYNFDNFYFPDVTDLPDADNVSVFDTSNYFFDELGYEYNTNEETAVIAELNARYDLDLGDKSGFIKAGLKYRANEKDADPNTTIYSAADDSPLTPFARQSSRFPFWDGPSLNQVAFREFYQADSQLGNNPRATVTLDGNGSWTANGTNTDFFEFEEEDTVESYFVDDFVSNEDVLAAYIMGSLTVGDVTYLGGVRVEHTEFETDGFSTDFNADGDLEAITPLGAENDYTNVLPSLHIKYELSDNSIFRFAATRTIARPKRSDSAIRRNIKREDEEVFIGNPDLDPYQATNIDVSFEHYFDRLGFFTLGVFYKDISDFIFIDGTGSITIDGDEFDLSTPANGDSAEITGIEVAYGQDLGLWTETLEGFRFDANVTLTDTTANYGEGAEDLPFLKQSDVIVNLAVSYERGPFFVRLAANYRDGYLDAFSDDATEREYTEDLWRVDLKSSYELSENWTAIFEVINLTDSPYKAYFGDDRLIMRQYEEYGVTYKFGLSWNM